MAALALFRFIGAICRWLLSGLTTDFREIAFGPKGDDIGKSRNDKKNFWIGFTIVASTTLIYFTYFHQ